MRAEFSEYSFGFAYTFEICTLWRKHLLSTPIFPSTRAEGKPGYEAWIGEPESTESESNRI